MSTNLASSLSKRLSVPDQAHEDEEPSPYLSVIIPVFNEEKGIAAVVDRLLRALDQQLPCSFELLVVDDGSTDQTAAQLSTLQHDKLRLIQHPYNIGNGAAVKSGIRNARGQYVLMMDADGQHRSEDIPKFLAQAGRYHMVVGARSKESEGEWHRNLANAIYNAFASYICNFPIQDLTSGFRLVDAKIAKGFVYLLPNSFSYPTTLTLAILKAGYTLHYVPIIAPRRLGKSKIKIAVDGVRFLTILFRVAVFFSPLRIFIPFSLFFFTTGFFWYLYRVFVTGVGFPPISSLFMTTSVIIFLIGLISEQITYLRYREP